MKVLIATDFSPVSQTAIEVVKARAWPADTTVCVLHVVDLAPFEPRAELLETAQQGAESLIKSIASDLERSGLKTRTEVLSGHPRVTVPEYAKKWGADFAVVGSYGRGGLARFLLGSVAQAVVRTAPCSVEVVRQGAQGLPKAGAALKILLATDGSDCSTAAVRSVGERPWPPRSCARIISVAPLVVPVADVSTAYFYADRAGGAVETIERELRSRAAEAIKRARELLRPAGLAQVETGEPLSGDPKAVILDEAAQWGADLIVVGSHGWRGIDRLMMGSVSESVAMHAHCSVEVIRG
ncbi:MAG: universal stress protein [Candidatus Acidiferrales bacterium]|jgi:nucleotide-binding universal stress UspA family protein